MGRGSQLFWFLNSEKPSKLSNMTHLSITPELQALRAKYRANLKNQTKDPKNTEEVNGLPENETIKVKN